MERLEALSGLFQAATAAEGAEREGVLARAGELGLRAELERLLEADRRNEDGFLAEPLIDGAGVRSGEPCGALLEPGSELGGCRVSGVLSRGATSNVYLAEQGATGRRVAIKVLHSGSAREILVRFEQERRIVALLNHENIAALHDAGATADGRAFYVMEYVDGRPITAYCEEGGLPLRARLGLFVQLCAAIEHAHLHGIIHRDLKPLNILVAEGTGGAPLVKVIDFGIARSMYRSGDVSATANGQVLGTIGYMAPEQLDGGGSLADTRTDCYALGAVLYELLTGSPAVPTEGAGPLTVMMRITRERPARPSALRPRLRGDLERIIEKALQKEPSQRYQTVEGLRTDITRYLEGRPVAARRPSPVYVVTRLIGRHRGFACAAAVLVLAAGVSVVRWRQAEGARFDLALEMADSWFDYSRRMSKTIGEWRHRGPLLMRLDAQSESLHGRAPSHPEVMGLRADVIGACGDLALERGSVSEARRRFEEVLALRRRLAERQPGALGARADLSVALVRLGDASWSRGDLAGTRARYAEALAIDETLVRDYPNAARAVTLLGWSCDRMARLSLELGNEEESAERFRRGLEVFQKLVTLEDSADAHRGLSIAWLQVGDVARRRGDTGEWHRCLRVSLDEGDRAVERSPADRLALWHQLAVRRTHFLTLRDTMTPDEARARSEQAAETARIIVTRDPDDVETRRHLIAALEWAAECAERAGDAEGASRHRAEGVRERERLAEHESLLTAGLSGGPGGR